MPRREAFFFLNVRLTAHLGSSSAPAAGRGSPPRPTQPDNGRRAVALCKENKIEEAARLHELHPTCFSASALISAFGRRRDLKRALATYDRLVAAAAVGGADHHPNMVVINALIGACRRCGEPGQALRLLDDIDRFGLELDDLGFHLLAAAAGEAGDAVAAKRLLARLQGPQRFKANIVDCGQLAKALVANQQSSASAQRTSSTTSTTKLADALSLLDAMDRHSIAPDRQLFEMLLPACVDNVDADLGRRLCAHIHSNKVALSNSLASGLITMYSRCGLLHDAVAVYDELIATTAGGGGRPDAVVINALIGAYRQCSEPGQALRLLDDMDRFGVELDNLGFRLLAAAAGEAGDAVAAKRLLERLPASGADGLDCHQLIKALLGNVGGGGQGMSEPNHRAASSRIADALSVLDVMDQRGIGKHANHLSPLVTACTVAGNVDLGRQVHARIRESLVALNDSLGSGLINMYATCGFLPDAVAVYDALIAAPGGQQPRPGPAVINALIGAYRQCGEPGQALRLLDDIDRFGLELDDLGFRLLAAVAGDAGDAVAAKRLMARLQRRLVAKAEADDVACGQLIKGLLGSVGPDSPHASSRLADALALLQTMDEQGIPTNSYHVTLPLAVCAATGEVGIGRQLHERILRDSRRANGVVHDFVVASLVDMYAKCGFLDEAIGVFTDARRHEQDQEGERRFEVGVSTWTAMIMALGQHGRGADALALFDDMRRMPLREGEPKLEPNEVTLTAVLNACSHAGLVDEALAIYRTFAATAGSDGHALLTTRSQTCIVDALGRAGRLDDAEQFIAAHIPQPDEVTWKTLLGACRLHGDVARAERIAEHLLQLAPGDASSRVLLGNVYAAAGRWEDKNRVRQNMRESGLRKSPGVSWIVVNGKRHVFAVEDKQHPRIKDIRAGLAVLWGQMKEAGFVPNTTNVLRPMSQDEAECHLCHHSEKLAIMFGLMSTPPGTTIRVFKNLRVCPDCHEATKFIARLTGREIVVRDANRFHHFNGHRCSCGDYW